MKSARVFFCVDVWELRCISPIVCSVLNLMALHIGSFVKAIAKIVVASFAYRNFCFSRIYLKACRKGWLWGMDERCAKKSRKMEKGIDR